MASNPEQEQPGSNNPENAPTETPSAAHPPDTSGPSDKPLYEGLPPNLYVAPAENPYGAPPENPYAMPPQNPYANAPENPYATTPASEPYYVGGYMPFTQGPLPLGEAIRQLPGQYLRVLTRPGAMTFAAEMGKASWDIVWVQLIFLAIVTAGLSYLGVLINRGLGLGTTTSNPALSPSMAQAIQALTLGSSLGNIILVPLLFFIGMGILFGLARAFGGQGRFVTQCYTILLFDVPLRILIAIVGLIPFAGPILAIAGYIYDVVLAIFAIMAVHRLTGGRASAVVLIPIGVALVLACALVIVVVAIIISAAQNVH